MALDPAMTVHSFFVRGNKRTRSSLISLKKCVIVFSRDAQEIV